MRDAPKERLKELWREEDLEGDEGVVEGRRPRRRQRSCGGKKT